MSSLIPVTDFTWPATVPIHERKRIIATYHPAAPHVSDGYWRYVTTDGRNCCTSYAETQTCRTDGCRREHIPAAQCLKKFGMGRDESNTIKIRRGQAVAAGDGNLLPENVMPLVNNNNPPHAAPTYDNGNGRVTGANAIPMGSGAPGTNVTAQEPPTLVGLNVPGIKRGNLPPTTGDFDPHVNACICPLESVPADMALTRCSISLPEPIARTLHRPDAEAMEQNEILFEYAVMPIPTKLVDTLNASAARMDYKEWEHLAGEMEKRMSGRTPKWPTCKADLDGSSNRKKESGSEGWRQEMDAFKAETRQELGDVKSTVARIEENQGKTTSILDKMLDRLSQPLQPALPHFGNSAGLPGGNAAANDPTLPGPAIANGTVQAPAFPGVVSNEGAVQTAVGKGGGTVQAPAFPGAVSKEGPVQTAVGKDGGKNNSATTGSDNNHNGKGGPPPPPALNLPRADIAAKARSRLQEILGTGNEKPLVRGRSRSKSVVSGRSPSRAGTNKPFSKISHKQLIDVSQTSKTGLKDLNKDLERAMAGVVPSMTDGHKVMLRIDETLVKSSACFSNGSAKALSTRTNNALIDVVTKTKISWKDLSAQLCVAAKTVQGNLTYKTYCNLLIRGIESFNITAGSVIVTDVSGARKIKDAKTGRLMLTLIYVMTKYGHLFTDTPSSYNGDPAAPMLPSGGGAAASSAAVQTGGGAAASSAAVPAPADVDSNPDLEYSFMDMDDDGYDEDLDRPSDHDGDVDIGASGSSATGGSSSGQLPDSWF